MANYTAEQLSGTGTPIEALTAGTLYNFILIRDFSLTGSCYFTIEQQGSPFTSIDDTNAVGVYDFTTEPGSVAGAVSSSYIFSVVVQPTPDFTSSFTFTPTSNIAVSSSYLRATGDMTLEITV